jgi:hypothetical protein
MKSRYTSGGRLDNRMTINDKSAADRRASQQTRSQLTDHAFPPLDQAVSQDSIDIVYRYGRLIVDISKIYSNKWKHQGGPNFPNLIRDLTFSKFRFVYACLKNLGDKDDLRNAIDTAVREFNPDNHPCVLKLYLDMPKDIDQMKRKSVCTIGGKKYWVFVYYLTRRAILPLSENYEMFLSKLGKHTRRNLRNVKKKAIKSGIIHQMEQFLLFPSPERVTLRSNAYPLATQLKTIAAYERLIEIQHNGFHSILRSQSGDIISCCSGFIEGDVASIIYQLNHHDYLKHNPSLTNRAFLIETLIQAGIKNVSFIYGCEGILGHSCIDESGTNILVIRRSFLGLLCVITYLFQFPVSVTLNRLADIFKNLAVRILHPSQPRSHDA